MTTTFQQAGPITIEGDGTQNAVGNTVSGDLVQQAVIFLRGRSAMYLGRSQVAARMAAYVPAGNHSLIVQALELDRCAVIAGPAGSGREITAMAAMRELAPALPFRRFSLEDEDTEEIGARRHCGYLIHARDGLARLPQCLDAIRAADSYLAVVADDWAGQVGGLPSVVLEPPPAVSVYRHWVAVTGHGSWAAWDQAARLLDGARPANGRRLASLVEQIERNGATDAAAGRREQVLKAYQDWSTDLRDWFRAHQRPHDRALLVAAAALAPDSEKRVYAAAADLAQRLHIEVHGAGLAWCPVTELGALLDEHQQDSRVVFNRLGFAESTLRHTIADYPLARSDLLTWLAAVVTESLGGARPRVSLAGTFTDVAAEHGEAGCIVQTVGAWAGTDNANPDFNANPAYIALSRSCLHPLVGGPIRRAMYDWSRRANTPATLKIVIAQVCELLGQTYPSIALTRLKHLATRGNGQVVEQVKSSVRALVELGQHPEVLKAVMAWCASADTETLSAAQRRRRRRVGAELFLEFAAAGDGAGRPRLLGGTDGGTRTGCLNGWRAALDLQVESGGPSSEFRATAEKWLDAAVSHAALRADITFMFAQAAGAPYLPPRAEHGSNRELTADVVMTDVAQVWYAARPHTGERRDVLEAVTVPLTRGWWRRWFRRNWIRLRDWYATRSGPR